MQVSYVDWGIRIGKEFLIISPTVLTKKSSYQLSFYLHDVGFIYLGTVTLSEYPISPPRPWVGCEPMCLGISRPTERTWFHCTTAATRNQYQLETIHKGKNYWLTVALLFGEDDDMYNGVSKLMSGKCNG